MKKNVLKGTIVVIAYLVVALHQVHAQEKPTVVPEAPPMAKVTEVVPTGISAGKVYLTGSATLVGGKADVKFKETLSESASDIKVIVTPVGSWSGIYVMNMSMDGFTVMSEAGDPNARFNWIVVGE